MLPARELSKLRRSLLAWHRRHALDAPWRESGDPYHALVAAVMAQQTQMSRVLLKYGDFIERFPTVGALAAATPGDVLRVWAPLGYNMRALRLHRAAQRIAREGFPRTAEDLARIDGIGPFTAAIVASFGFSEPVAAVDTNVRRIVERLLSATANGAIGNAANSLLSRRAPARWNQAMMDLGAIVCTARDPACEACPLASWCRWRQAEACPSERGEMRTAEPRATYRAETPFKHSRRYLRGRIVQVLRELPAGRSMAKEKLFERIRRAEGGPSEPEFGEILDGLRRDGLVSVARGRVRLP